MIGFVLDLLRSSRESPPVTEEVHVTPEQKLAAHVEELLIDEKAWWLAYENKSLPLRVWEPIKKPPVSVRVRLENSRYLVLVDGYELPVSKSAIKSFVTRVDEFYRQESLRKALHKLESVDSQSQPW